MISKLFGKVSCWASNKIMDGRITDDEDDILASSHERLLNLIRKNKANAIETFVKEIKYPAISDFSKGLEWFNVSEPLSFEKHLKGKLVLLDFFTYCCINCMHILPDLKEIERQFTIEDGLVVIGVHSAKFENEKASDNILSAVQRYNITHAVVNDHESTMWRNCEVHCWPTLVLLGPKANPLLMLTGEGHKDELLLYIGEFLRYYKSQELISSHRIPLKTAYHLLPRIRGPLLFPGKIAIFGDLIAISDSGNHRVLIVRRSDGRTIAQFGKSGKSGLADGNKLEAAFNNPQGLAFQDSNTLFVADTNNHAIRRLDLKKGRVETVAGNGKQGNDRTGGKIGTEQAIASPWDLAIHKNDQGKDILLIAMAGTHQIWALFLHDDTLWWKGKKYGKYCCINIAGSGREENRNNSYPHMAAFAQPSGLALCKRNQELYIADSESSAVRRLSLVDGKVTPVVGGDKNPNNLFAFGDKDGALFDAKLQHSLGVALDTNEKYLYVADTYNHKLKRVDIDANTVQTLQITANEDSPDFSGIEGRLFNEPAGVCVANNGQLFVADTNNHNVKVIDIVGNRLIVSHFNIHLIDKDKYQHLRTNQVKLSNSGGSLVLNFDWVYKDGLKLNEAADQEWFSLLPHPLWHAEPQCGSKITKEIKIFYPENEDNGKLEFVFNLATCTDETCIMSCFLLEVPFVIEKDGALGKDQLKLQINITPNSISL